MDTIEYGVHFGWVVYLDVYGLKAMMKERQYLGLAERLSKCYSEVKCKLPWDESQPVYLNFQDTVMLFYSVDASHDEDKFSVLQRCLGDVQEILVIFFQAEFPLRGGIAYGEVAYNANLLLGSAVERAIQYEKEVAAPLVLLPAKEYVEMSDNASTCLSSVAPRVQDVALKDGGFLYGILLHPRPVDGFVKFIREKYRHHGLYGPPEVAKAWGEAYLYICERFHPSEEDNP